MQYTVEPCQVDNLNKIKNNKKGKNLNTLCTIGIQIKRTLH